jgi:hypothetical protein
MPIIPDKSQDVDTRRRSRSAGGLAAGTAASAEREGFEPSRHLSAPTRFPVALLRPLGHLSERAQRIAYLRPSTLKFAGATAELIGA